MSLPERERRLRRLLEPIRNDFDRIFIDCPPSLGLLTLNALVAADAVLIPLHCEYFALEGLAALVSTLRRVRASLNPSLDIEGVLLTMHDERTNLGQQVARDVREFFKEKVFDTVIPRNVRLGEAPSHGKPVILYDVKSRGAEAYLALAREMLARSSGASPRRDVAAASAVVERVPFSSATDRRRAHHEFHSLRCRGTTMEKRNALGKGLSALIPDAPLPPPPADAPVTELDIDALAPNDLPAAAADGRRAARGARPPRFDRTASSSPSSCARPAMDSASSPASADGAPRSAPGSLASPWSSRTSAPSRASQKLLELALIENIQREDLNPIDEAKAYRRLVDEFHLTQDAVASAVGKDRATVANTLRLLKLPPEVQNDVASSALSMGHARALLALPADAVQLQAAREVKTRGLSVRETEALVKSALEGREIGAPTPRQAKAAPPPDVHTRAAEDKLKMQLGTRVRIIRKARGGRIEIDFTSEDELIRIYDALDGASNAGLRCSVVRRQLSWTTRTRNGEHRY